MNDTQPNVIPKKIHYVWGYNEPKPKFIQTCITSWTTVMPSYEIIEWNEVAMDYSALASECTFFEKAQKIKLWAYMADYIRLKVLYEHGGIYLDTDVQVVKPMDDLLDHELFLGLHRSPIPEFNKGGLLVEGAVIGATPKHPFLKDMLAFYQHEMMQNNFAYLPQAIYSVLNKKYGMSPAKEDKNSTLSHGIRLYASDYFYPLMNDKNQYILSPRKMITPNSYTIHWHSNSYVGSLKFDLFMNHRASSCWKKVNAILVYLFYALRRTLRHLLKDMFMRQ